MKLSKGKVNLLIDGHIMPKKLSNEEITLRLFDRFGTKIVCLELYKGMFYKHKFKCECSNKWETKYSNILNSSIGCPLCAKVSSFKGNKYLLKHKKFKDCNGIVITNKKGRIVGIALIDSEDKELCKKYTWHLDSDGYVVSTTTGKTVKLHRLVMKPPLDKEIDHIKHNTLDNRKSKLRICTRQQNAINIQISSRNNSGIKGVSEKFSGKHEVNIRVNGKDKYLGRYSCIKKATKVYNKAAVKYYGEFACINK